MTRLSDIAKEVREQQDADLANNARRLAVRNRLLSQPRGRSQWPWLRVSAIGVAGAAAVAFVFMFMRSETKVPVTFAIGSEPGEVGRFIAAPARESVPLSFSDGSTVALGSRSRARVVGLTHRGARLHLEHGEAYIDVVHRKESEWWVHGGPYKVHVIGTRFTVKWDAADHVFAIAMDEGAVRVSGPDVEQRTVRAGEQIAFGARRGRDEQGKRAAQLVRDSETETEELAKKDIEKKGPARVKAATRASATKHGRPTETSAARAEDEALLRALGNEGFAQRLRQGTVSEVEQVADASRRVHDPRTPRAYLALRSRFRRHRAATEAAFQLGRFYAQENNVKESSQWFRTYLRESPNGPWARDSLGRLIEMASKNGTIQEASDLAAKYLERFPDGPHSEFARDARARAARARAQTNPSRE